MKLVLVLIIALVISGLLGLGLTSWWVNRQQALKVNMGSELKAVKYVEQPGSEQKVSLYGPFDDHFGNTYITAIGLKQSVVKQGDRYLLSLLTIYSGKAYLLNIDLSTKGYILSWLERDNNNPNSPIYRNLNADQVYEKLINSDKKVLRVDVMTKLNPETVNDPKCLQDCKLVYSEFAKYSAANTWLEQIVSNKTQSDISVKTYGVVRLVYETL